MNNGQQFLLIREFQTPPPPAVQTLVNCLGALLRNSVVRITDGARNDLKCVEGP